MRLMWVLIVWLLRNRRSAISPLVRPRAISPRISTSRWVRPSGGSGEAAAGGGAGGGGGGPGGGRGGDRGRSAEQRGGHARVEHGQPAGRGSQRLRDVGAVGVLGEVAARA